MDHRKLERQVDRILAEGSGDRRSVLIQVSDPAEDRGALLRAASTALTQRALVLTARDCLPVQREDTAQLGTIPRSRPTTEPSGLSGSLSTQVHSTTAPSAQQARRQAVRDIGSVMGNARVRESLERASERAGHDVSEKLWAAGAVAVDLDADALRALPAELEGVEGIYVNRRLRTPPVTRVQNFPAQVLENRTSAWGLHRIGALATWGAYGARGAGSRVAVLDTGVDASHPDLAERVAAFAEFDAMGSMVEGAQPNDSGSHGTHVCGTIAGGNASGQWIGVAPEAELLVGKVLGPDGGTDAQVLAGMTWAAEQQVDVLSMSLGAFVLGPQTPPLYTSALITCLQRGIPVVVAIGNEGSQTTGSPGNDLFALAVGATDHLDRPAGFSGGRTQVIEESEVIDPKFLPLLYSKPDVSAPGVAVASSVPNGSWEAFNGTSMATPHVAGAVALLLSATRIRDVVPAGERAFVIQDLLVGSVDELGEAGQDHRHGFGLVNALRAIGFARERGY